MIHMIGPMMPHLAEECWSALGQPALLAEADWPEVNRALLVEDEMTLPVQVNGRKRADLTIARNADAASIEAAVLSLDAVRRAMEGRPVRKVIVVPQRIVNVVA
jgi:leucyl-tRNA synthetase